MKHMQPKVGFVSLGCPKALVDSEQIITQLRAEGYAISATYDDADLVVINTCGFIESAIDESLETIGDALGQNGKVIVTGCLGAKGDIVKNTYPNVLAVTGPHALQEVMDAVHAHLPPAHDPYTSLIPPQGIKLTPRHYAYLKISEGCNHRCSFCIIPALRGDLVSRPVNDVLQDAHHLVAAGVKELLVISQDTSAYGVDTKYKTTFWNGRPVKTRFQELVSMLSEFDTWVRLHYVYPYPHVDEVIPLMAQGKLLPYLDIPFQHASPSILKAMKRPASSENVLERLARWRDICPEIAIRSTFIVGFPGETEREFDELLEFLEAAQLDRVGCFKYSPVAGARSNALPDPVDEDTKQERLDLFMQVQEHISRGKLQQKIGQQLTVLVDEVNDQEILARSRYDAPEVDGLVIIEEDIGVKPGDWLRVKVTGSTEHDLYAEVVKSV
ncbi:MAG TPA: 30S ribosomal protein S12 methylthiotransferase RimO [Gammaproteobacteria bacterium]